jgi:hypothetical protein
MENPIHSRKFEVNYYEQSVDCWRIVSHLQDDAHDICATLEISVPEMIVLSAIVEFGRYPLEDCPVVAAKMQALIGANLFEDFSERMRQLFRGAEGCPNVLNLLSTSTPGLIYFYYPDQLKKGKMTPAEWQQLVSTRLANDCLAHKLTRQRYAANQSALPKTKGA